MIALLLAAAAAAAQPVEQAERAFASMAQTQGQWTAFRAFAAPNAIMLLDGPQPATPFLQGREDPQVAVMWWPAHTVTSCDGSLAFSTGPWRRVGGTLTGRYFTIWRRDQSGWHWVYDGGSEDQVARPAGDRVAALRASCGSGQPLAAQQLDIVGGGGSKDNSLRWTLVRGETGKYRLDVTYRVGTAWKTESAAVG